MSEHLEQGSQMGDWQCGDQEVASPGLGLAETGLQCDLHGPRCFAFMGPFSSLNFFIVVLV